MRTNLRRLSRFLVMALALAGLLAAFSTASLAGDECEGEACCTKVGVACDDLEDCGGLLAPCSLPALSWATRVSN